MTFLPALTASALIPIRKSWPVLGGLAVLYVPTYVLLAVRVWQAPETAHGAFFFLLLLWMIFARRSALLAVTYATRPVLGALTMTIGLLCFVIGRSQEFLLLEVLSQIPVFIGVLLLTKGTRVLRVFWFPIAFLVFLAPLPGSLLDALLMPLKQFVSATVEQGLYTLGYPIARNGVVLTIGAYQLLIADACAGLNSIIALSGIGLAFIFLAERARHWHNALLLVSVLPIAVFANVLRVTSLTLITFHFGEDMGQRFHNIAGMVEVFFALGAFFMLDSVITQFGERRMETAQ